MLISKPILSALHHLTDRNSLPTALEAGRRKDAEVNADAASAETEVRWEKIAALRAQIDSGSFDVEARLDDAVDRLMNDLAETKAG